MRTTVTILDLDSDDFKKLRAAGEDLSMFSPEAMNWYIRTSESGVNGSLLTGEDVGKREVGTDGEYWNSHGFKNLRMEDNKLLGDMKVYGNRDGQTLAKIIAAGEPVRYDIVLDPNYSTRIMHQFQKFKLIRINAYVDESSFRKHSFKR